MFELCKKLFESFNVQGVKYCLWKSNEHLEAALSGDTDLDVLVSEQDYAKAIDILLAQDFREFMPLGYLSYKGIEDYIGCDLKTGTLVHIHLHTELRIGRKFVKNYHLPIEELVFNNLSFDKNNTVFTIDPNIEIILLVIRSILKKKSVLHRDLGKEFTWLLERIDRDKVSDYSQEILGKACADSLVQFINDHTNTALLKQLTKSVSAHMTQLRTHSSFPLLYKNVLKGAWNYARNRLKSPVPYKRTFKDTGRTVAVIGVDGAGKSTVVKETASWGRKKIDTYTIYFGSGSGSSSLLRYPLHMLVGIYKKIKRTFGKPSSGNLEVNNSTGKEQKTADKKTEDKPRSHLYKTVRAVWAILLTFEKKGKFNKMNRAKKNRMLVICDRYPQAQIMGFNDGPLLSEWLESRSTVKQRIAEWEQNIYSRFDTYPLDAAVKLITSKETAKKRKPDTADSIIKKKIEAVQNLTFSSETKVAVIDASEPLENVLVKVKQHIWSA